MTHDAADALDRIMRFRAEFGAESPLWTERGEMVWLEEVPLGDELREALTAWAEGIWDAYDTQTGSSEQSRWIGEGKRLFQLTQAALSHHGVHLSWDDP